MLSLFFKKKSPPPILFCSCLCPCFFLVVLIFCHVFFSLFLGCFTYSLLQRPSRSSFPSIMFFPEPFSFLYLFFNFY